MKRSSLQPVSLDDARRRRLVTQIIQRGHDKPTDTIAWYDGLSVEDKKALIVGVQLGLLEMVNSIKNLSASITPLLGAMARDVENRGNDEVDNADIT